MSTQKQTVKLVQKRAKFASVDDIVRLQLMLYCFTKEIKLSDGDYHLLTHIAIHGYDRSKTPVDLVASRKFLHIQSVRNTRNKLVNRGLIIESPKRNFILNPELKIESKGVIMVEFKAINA